MTSDEARAIFNYLMQRAATDRNFRNMLLHNPRTTLEREFEVELPPYFNIRFVENHGADLTIVLPDPIGADDRLQDGDLESVAGGVEVVRDMFVQQMLRLNWTR